VVEAVVQRRYLPGKEVERPEGPQSKAQSQDEGEHGPGLETGLLPDLLDCGPGVVRRHVQRRIGPWIAFSRGWLKSSCTTSRIPAAMYLLVCAPSMAGSWRTWTIVTSSATVKRKSEQ